VSYRRALWASTAIGIAGARFAAMPLCSRRSRSCRSISPCLRSVPPGPLIGMGAFSRSGRPWVGRALSTSIALVADNAQFHQPPSNFSRACFLVISRWSDIGGAVIGRGHDLLWDGVSGPAGRACVAHSLLIHWSAFGRDGSARRCTYRFAPFYSSPPATHRTGVGWRACTTFLILCGAFCSSADHLLPVALGTDGADLLNGHVRRTRSDGGGIINCAAIVGNWTCRSSSATGVRWRPSRVSMSAGAPSYCLLAPAIVLALEHQFSSCGWRWLVVNSAPTAAIPALGVHGYTHPFWFMRRPRLFLACADWSSEARWSVATPGFRKTGIEPLFYVAGCSLRCWHCACHGRRSLCIPVTKRSANRPRNELVPFKRGSRKRTRRFPRNVAVIHRSFGSMSGGVFLLETS